MHCKKKLEKERRKEREKKKERKKERKKRIEKGRKKERRKEKEKTNHRCISATEKNEKRSGHDSRSFLLPVFRKLEFARFQD